MNSETNLAKRRLKYLKILIVQKMIDESVKKALAGKDLPASEWAVKEGVVTAGVSEGITDGQRPQGYAKREEVWAMILRALKVVRNND